MDLSTTPAPKIEKPEIELTEEQSTVFKQLKKFSYEDSNSYALFEGAAGVGKTTLISFLIEELINNALFGNICCVSPTHKALKVMRNMCHKNQDKIGFSTLHSLLGLKCKITKEGKEVFERDRNGISKLTMYDFLIIDEASMIADELFQELHDQNYKGIKVLFVGDGNQINPINHTHSIPMLEEQRKLYEISHYKLNTVVRQAANNPIIKYSQKVLKDEFEFINGTKEIVDNSGVVMISTAQMDVLNGLMKHYFCSKEFDDNADYCRVIAWRNATVERFNHTIRKMKYGPKATKIVLNEKLIVDRPIKTGDDNTEVLFHTNEDLVVRDIQETTKSLYGVQFKIYRTFVSGDETQDYIDIIHERFEGMYNQMLKKFADDANSERDIGKRISHWKKYFSFIDNFAQIKYGYCQTVHTCINSNEMINVKNKGLIYIKDVVENDFVLNNTKYSKVLKKINTGFKKEFLLTTNNGYSLRCSAEHPILTVDSNEFIFKKLSELKITDTICINRNFFNNEIKDCISPLMGWYLGLMVGDGNYSGNYHKSINRGEITTIKTDYDDYTVLRDLELEFEPYNLKVNIYHPPNRNVIRIVCDNKLFRDYLESLGLKRGAKKQYKTTPSVIFQSSPPIQKQYLKGLFDSDGSVSKKVASIRFVNKSEKLVDEMMLLLLNFGIISKKTVNKRGYFTLAISGPSFALYRKYIGFNIKRKQQLLDSYVYKFSKTNNDNIPFKNKIKDILHRDWKFLCSAKDKKLCRLFNSSKNLSYDHLSIIIERYKKLNIPVDSFIDELNNKHFFYDSIKSIIDTEKETEMFDITVENEHMFSCNGIEVHNCQGSTYENAFVFLNDINANWKEEERKRILYTAITRPKKMLYIF